MSKKNIRLLITEKQLLVMREALEFYSRFISGQITDLPEVLRSELNAHRNENAMRLLAEFKAEVFPELRHGEAYGVGAPRKSNELQNHRQISYECYRQIYVYQCRKSAEAGNDVSFSVYRTPTMRYSNEPLMDVKEIKNEQ